MNLPTSVGIPHGDIVPAEIDLSYHCYERLVRRVPEYADQNFEALTKEMQRIVDEALREGFITTNPTNITQLAVPFSVGERNLWLIIGRSRPGSPQLRGVTVLYHKDSTFGSESAPVVFSEVSNEPV